MFIYESFISDNENNNAVQNIFITIAFMFLSLFIAGIFVWAYYYNPNNQYLFIAILSFLMIIYTIINLIYIILNKNNIDNSSYVVILSTSIYMIFMLFIIILYFSIKVMSYKPSTIIPVANTNTEYV